MMVLAYAAVFAFIGFGVGMGYCALVRRTASQLAAGELGVAGALSTAGLRLLLFAAGAVVAVVLSLGVLVGYMAGFITARSISVGFARRTHAS
jgi:hypothetical protein